MTTTSVKDVTTVMSAMVASTANSVGATSDVSFQSVWNNQANKNPSTQETEDSAAEPRKTNPREEILKAKETVRKPVKDVSKNEVDEAGLSEEQTEEAMEVLGTAAGEMMQQVADTFGISVEELSQMMDELNMDTLDILNPEMLSALLLKASGATDTMALLTNEGLYADYKQLMDFQQQVLAEAGSELQMTTDQMTQLFAELENQVVNPQAVEQDVLTGTPEESVVEITVEGDEAEEASNTKNNGEIINNTGNAQMQSAEETLTVQQNEGGRQAQQGREQQQGQSNEQTGNPFLQNLKSEMLQPEVSMVQAGTMWDADTQDIMRQIMDYMKIQVKPDMSNLEMQLHPESLGTLQIQVSSKGGVVTANFVTQNEAVKAALESQMIQLKENFAEQGVKVESIEVTVQAHQFERNLDQGRGNNHDMPERRGRTRRINLNVDAALGESEELSQEDALAAEIMTANGNTVDYTA